jgi:hypothetical protein
MSILVNKTDTVVFSNIFIQNFRVLFLLFIDFVCFGAFLDHLHENLEKVTKYIYSRFHIYYSWPSLNRMIDQRNI